MIDGANSTNRELSHAMTVINEQTAGFRADVAIVFGSGLSEAAHTAIVEHEIPYAAIPGMVAPKVLGHPGKLVLGKWSDQRVALFLGRSHYYEGHPWSRVTLPIRIAHDLGAPVCIVTNSSGGVNPQLAPGQLVCIADQINMIGSNPLIGATATNHATMFTDMTTAYCPKLRAALSAAAHAVGVSLAHGVYLAVSGPNYETPAEIRAFRSLGADMVGMSTVGEVLVARHLGMRCLGVSCVSNHAAGVVDQPIDHQEVLAAGKRVAGDLGTLLTRFLRDLSGP